MAEGIGLKSKRMAREQRTVAAMLRLYCHAHHQPTGELCDECQALLAYAESRLQRCPYQGAKPTCARCPTHCYRRDMRQRIRAVMRYAGPRMIWHHPLLAVQHLLDGLRRSPRQDAQR